MVDGTLDTSTRLSSGWNSLGQRNEVLLEPGDEESESSRPEHVGEGECEVLKAEAVAGSDDDEPRVYGVVGERPCSSPTFYTALPEALLLALPMATRRI